MISPNMEKLIPRFLWNDRNGHALAKAVEAGLQMFCQIVQTGIETTLDVDRMPEWRLDEMAWELGCLYDYTADVESKRTWISKAKPLFAALGTRQAIANYLEGYFETVNVEECWQYDGDPYHFRVVVTGEYSESTNAWAMKAIEETKNVRSVLDALLFNGGTSTAGAFAFAAVQAVEVRDEAAAS